MGKPQPGCPWPLPCPLRGSYEQLTWAPQPARTQKAYGRELSGGSGAVAASQANSLPSRVIWAASGAGSAPRQPALRTALPAPQYRLHLRHIASGCSHRRLSHRIASQPIALSLRVPRRAAARRGRHWGGCALRGAHEAARTPCATQRDLLPPNRGVPSPWGWEEEMSLLPPASWENGHGRGRAGQAGRAGHPHRHGLPLASIAGSCVAHLRPRAGLRCSAASPRCTCAW